MPLTQEASMAKMQSDIDHLTKSFDEFKQDTKSFHELQSRKYDELGSKLDEFASKWQEFGGVTKGLVDVTMRINSTEKNLEDNYVRKEEFDPIKKLVYGAVGLSLSTLLAAILILVIKQ